MAKIWSNGEMQKKTFLLFFMNKQYQIEKRFPSDITLRFLCRLNILLGLESFFAIINRVFVMTASIQECKYSGQNRYIDKSNNCEIEAKVIRKICNLKNQKVM